MQNFSQNSLPGISSTTLTTAPVTANATQTTNTRHLTRATEQRGRREGHPRACASAWRAPDRAGDAAGNHATPCDAQADALLWAPAPA